eukprot:m.99867 g.99867  ORF g.99867 m.99867 type:complete len:69 (+) comp12473_c0_seq1:1082-1288(+)
MFTYIIKYKNATKLQTVSAERSPVLLKTETTSDLVDVVKVSFDAETNSRYFSYGDNKGRIVQGDSKLH